MAHSPDTPHEEPLPQGITLSPAELAELRKYLGTLPYDHSAPLIEFFAQRVRQTQQQVTPHEAVHQNGTQEVLPHEAVHQNGTQEVLP